MNCYKHIYILKRSFTWLDNKKDWNIKMLQINQMWENSIIVNTVASYQEENIG